MHLRCCCANISSIVCGHGASPACFGDVVLCTRVPRLSAKSKHVRQPTQPGVDARQCEVSALSQWTNVVSDACGDGPRLRLRIGGAHCALCLDVPAQALCIRCWLTIELVAALGPVFADVALCGGGPAPLLQLEGGFDSFRRTWHLFSGRSLLFAAGVYADGVLRRARGVGSSAASLSRPGPRGRRKASLGVGECAKPSCQRRPWNGHTSTKHGMSAGDAARERCVADPMACADTISGPITCTDPMLGIRPITSAAPMPFDDNFACAGPAPIEGQLEAIEGPTRDHDRVDAGLVGESVSVLMQRLLPGVATGLIPRPHPGPIRG